MTSSNRVRIAPELFRAIEARSGPRFMTVAAYVSMVLGEHLASVDQIGTVEPTPPPPPPPPPPTKPLSEEAVKRVVAAWSDEDDDTWDDEGVPPMLNPS